MNIWNFYYFYYHININLLLQYTLLYFNTNKKSYFIKNINILNTLLLL